MRRKKSRKHALKLRCDGSSSPFAGETIRSKKLADSKKKMEIDAIGSSYAQTAREKKNRRFALRTPSQGE
jgi:hypothetical protein